MDFIYDLVGRVVFGRLLNVRPKVSKEGDVLVARSGWKSHLFSLGFGGRTVRVEPKQRAIKVRTRRFWGFTTSKRIDFDWVEAVLYGYHDASVGLYAYQANDLFTVGLQLKNGEEITLFRFFGEGDFLNNSIWPDWMYWSDILVAQYSRGTQESESLLFADLLSRMIGVPVENPRP